MDCIIVVSQCVCFGGLVPGGAATYPPAYLAFQSPWCIEKGPVSGAWKYVPMN